jgi:serine/threonine protein kinase
MIGYQNKSYYTAPELLSERGAIVSNPTKEGDIYSFGMMLYEIFTEKLPFKVIMI